MSVRNSSLPKQQLPLPGEHWHRQQPGNRWMIILLSVIGLAVLALSAPKLTVILFSKLSMNVSSLAVFQPDIAITSGLAIAGGCVRNALYTAENERRSVAAEQKAFSEFASGVQSLSTAQQTTGGGVIARISDAGAAGCQLKKVREQYRESVMSLPDYDSEYGETFEEHFAAEFGHEIASVVLNGQQLNKPVKHLLVQQARESGQHRQQLLDGLELEERSLHEARAHLEPIDAFLIDVKPNRLRTMTIPELVEIDDEIRKWQTQSESLLRTRQREIQTVNRRVGSGTENLLQEYLYQHHKVTFPVLHTVLEYINLLEQRHSTLIRTLCRR